MKLINSIKHSEMAHLLKGRSCIPIQPTALQGDRPLPLHPLISRSIPFPPSHSALCTRGGKARQFREWRATKSGSHLWLTTGRASRGDEASVPVARGNRARGPPRLFSRFPACVFLFPRNLPCVFVLGFALPLSSWEIIEAVILV